MDRLQSARRSVRACRRFPPIAIGAGFIAAVALPGPGAAQNVTDLQREVAQMRATYEAELKRLRQDYDARLRRLETRLKEAGRKPPVAPAAPVAIVAPPAAAPVAPAYRQSRPHRRRFWRRRRCRPFPDLAVSRSTKPR
jgi:hypothetical protein